MINPNIIAGAEKQNDLLGTIGRGLQFGQGLRQLLALRQTDKMNQIEADNEADTYAQRKAFANNSMFGRELNAALKADQAAKAQALMAQQKHEADTAKTWSDVTKNNADAGKIGVEAQGLGLKNSGTLLANANQALTVAAQTGDPMAAKLALNNAYKAGALGSTPELYEQYSKQIDILGTKPEALKQFAQSITIAGSEKPEQYIQPDANTVLNNQTAVDNNVRDNETALNGQQLTYKLGQDKLNQDQTQFDAKQAQDLIIAEQKLAFEKGEFETMTGIDGVQYAVYKDKRVEPLLFNEQPFKAAPKAGQQLSATAQKELFEVEDSISAANNALINLKDALKYSANAYDGVGAAQRAKAMGHLSDSEEAKNTVLLDNIVTGNALEMLKATFGSAPTEGERAILLQLQGSVNLPRNQREAIYTRAVEAAERRIKSNQAKAESIRTGSFFKSEQSQNQTSAQSNKNVSQLQSILFGQ